LETMFERAGQEWLLPPYRSARCQQWPRRLSRGAARGHSAGPRIAM